MSGLDELYRIGNECWGNKLKNEYPIGNAGATPHVHNYGNGWHIKLLTRSRISEFDIMKNERINWEGVFSSLFAIKNSIMQNEDKKKICIVVFYGVLVQLGYRTKSSFPGGESAGDWSELPEGDFVPIVPQRITNMTGNKRKKAKNEFYTPLFLALCVSFIEFIN
ncbi:MAG: hypothetical protein GY710_07850 [Desulfobacteraceae bacterium]|nr:hypothetical protein [Desulfobacteraceae bacterium]